MALWMVIFTTMVSLDRVHSLLQSRFEKHYISNVKDKIAEGCTIELSLPSLVSCLAECGRQSFCIGASLDKTTGNCFIHHACGLCTVSNTSDPNHDYYASYCLYGRWDSTKNSCVCELGTFGDRCEQAHQKCNETTPGLLNYDSHTVYLDPLKDGCLYKVRCDREGTLILMRNDGGMSFNRTWNDYLNGFESPDMSNHWLGLRSWYALTNMPSCSAFLSIRLRFGKPVPQSTIWCNYFDFTVGSKESKFSFTFGMTMVLADDDVPGFSKQGECMYRVQNFPFSTWDMTNNNDISQNCPSRVGSGWWHPQNCDSPCNFLGWGLEDLENTPREQRLSMVGLDMNISAAKVNFVDIAYTCLLN